MRELVSSTIDGKTKDKAVIFNEEDFRILRVMAEFTTRYLVGYKVSTDFMPSINKLKAMIKDIETIAT
jgi:hypothetical protein